MYMKINVNVKVTVNVNVHVNVEDNVKVNSNKCQWKQFYTNKKTHKRIYRCTNDTASLPLSRIYKSRHEQRSNNVQLQAHIHIYKP